MFRAQALRELNFYKNRPDYTEDYDLSVRMADADYGNVYCHTVLSYYRVWTDSKGVRPRRKGMELRGLIRVYQESLTPAFQRRNWNTKLLDQQRRRIALVHSTSCYSPWFNETEKAELTALLKELGDSTALRIKIFALKLGLNPFFEWWHATELLLKNMVKGLLSKAQGAT